MSIDIQSSYSSSTYSSDSESWFSDSSSVPSVPLQQLEAQTDGKVHSGIDLVKFVQQVWDIDSATITKLLSLTVPLVDCHKDDYIRSVNKREALRSFLAIVEHLLDSAAKGMGDETNETLGDTFWDQYDCHRHDIVNLLWTPLLPSDETPKLPLARCVLELKWEDDPEDATDSQSSGENSSSELVYRVSRKDSTTGDGEPQESVEHTSDVLDATNNLDNGGESPLRGCMLPLYAMEALSSSSRYYVTGLLIDGFQVTVCYFDRFLVACTESISLEYEPLKLALVLYASKNCDLLHTGFDPHLHKSCTGGRLREPDDSVPIERMLQVEGVVGSYFEYPATQVESAQPSTHVCLLVTAVIRRPRELIGRATAVYNVRRRIADDTFSEEPFVYKLSWPSGRSVSEVDIVKLLKQKLPEEAHGHLPEFIWSTSCSAEDLQLPWLRLGLNVDQGKRVLRGTLGEFYNQLWEVGSIDNFKNAWLDCVECLHLAHKVGETLHPGLSERDLMISNLADGGVNGVLNGWELGGDDTNRLRASALHFMAYELILDAARPHSFRHTLESMFYILNWAIIHYNLEDGERDAVAHPSVADWTLGDRERNARSKFCLISYEWGTIGEVGKAVRPEFADLYLKWVCPLRVLFTKARGDHYVALEDGEESDFATWGGRVTFKKLMAAINVEPRTWGIPGFLDDEE